MTAMLPPWTDQLPRNGARAVLRSFAILVALCAFNAPSFAADTDLKLLTKSDTKRYKSAFKAAKQGQWTTAYRTAKHGRAKLPRKLLRWMDMTQRGTTASFGEITNFIRQNPTWPRQQRLQRRAEEAIDENTSGAEILSWFAKRPPINTDGHIALGEALIATGKINEGQTHLRRAWITGRFNRRSERLFLRQHRKMFTAEDHWQRLDGLLWKRHYSSAHRMYRRVSPKLRTLAEARTSLRLFRGGVDRAIARVEPALRRDPGLLYERMRWRRRKGRTLDALEILKNPPNDLVRADLWSREREIISRRLLREGRITDAHRAISDHRVNPKNRARFAEAEWLSGWIELRYLNDARPAFDRFSKLHDVVRYPVSRARAAYWAGRAAKAAGNKIAANEWFRRAQIHPTTYHGQLAAEELGDILRLPPPVAEPDSVMVKALHRSELVKAFKILSQLGEKKLLRIFALRLGRNAKTNQERLLVGRLAYRIGRPDLAVWIARRAQRRGILAMSLGYPILPMPNGKPEKALLLSISRQESNFYPQAISPAGARGMMQLMPATARAVARSLRIRYSRSLLTQRPSYNIRLGRAYLSQMLSRFNGSYILSIASYNAGPHRAASWVKRSGNPSDPDVDAIDWIEMIPFRETRTYVQRVLGNLQVYRSRLQPGRVALTLQKDLKR
ncbi:MAG: transglycosylase SLT domain-containing protein [Alphaproteobacteria bacterium]|nr:transglycosylase SLT domain-containing protein [Alphaproteobacteria bacterium]